MDSVAVRLAMLIGIPMVVLVAAIVVTIYAYQRWSAKAVSAAAGQGWATTCVDPRRPGAMRTLCLERDAVILRGFKRKVVDQWPWGQIVAAVEGPVRPFNAVASHQGLILHLADGGTASFLFPSRSTFSYPAERLGEALQQVSRRLEARSVFDG